MHQSQIAAQHSSDNALARAGATLENPPREREERAPIQARSVRHHSMRSIALGPQQQAKQQKGQHQRTTKATVETVPTTSGKFGLNASLFHTIGYS